MAGAETEGKRRRIADFNAELASMERPGWGLGIFFVSTKTLNRYISLGGGKHVIVFNST